MLETEDERSKRILRNTILTIILILTLSSVLAAQMAWDAWGPLPQKAACEQKGYDGGQRINGETICYDNCPTNELRDCKKMMVLDE